MNGYLEVVLPTGILTFDGRVVEAFGFSYFDRSVRIHVASIDRIDVDEGGRFSDPSVTFHGGKITRQTSVYFPKEAAPQVIAFVEAVRAAAPQLQPGPRREPFDGIGDGEGSARGSWLPR